MYYSLLLHTKLSFSIRPRKAFSNFEGPQRVIGIYLELGLLEIKVFVYKSCGELFLLSGEFSASQAGKNAKSLFFLLGLKFTLRICFESKNFSSNSWGIFSTIAFLKSVGSTDQNALYRVFKHDLSNFKPTYF